MNRKLWNFLWQCPTCIHTNRHMHLSGPSIAGTGTWRTRRPRCPSSAWNRVAICIHAESSGEISVAGLTWSVRTWRRCSGRWPPAPPRWGSARAPWSSHRSWVLCSHWNGEKDIVISILSRFVNDLACLPQLIIALSLIKRNRVWALPNQIDFEMSACDYVQYKYILSVSRIVCVLKKENPNEGILPNCMSMDGRRLQFVERHVLYVYPQGRCTGLKTRQ